MKINRYQGWINNKCFGAINDHQENECIIEFEHMLEKSDNPERMREAVRSEIGRGLR